MGSIKELIKKTHDIKEMIYFIAYREGIDVATYIEFRKAHDLCLFLNPDELNQAIKDIVISGNHSLFLNKQYNLVYGKFLKHFINENKTHKINIINSLHLFIRLNIQILLMNLFKLI